MWTGGFGSFTGPAAIEAMLVENLGAPEPGFVNKSQLPHDDQPADRGGRRPGERRNRSTCSGPPRPTRRPSPLLAGRYVDEFVKQGGEWKIARRTTWGQIPFRDPNAPPAPGGGPAAAPALRAPRRASARLEDQLAIQRVLVEYAARIDAQDFDGYADLFAREGEWRNGNTVRKGRAEIKELLVGLFGTPPEGFVNRESYHLVSNPQVEVNGDRATARSRHLLIMRGRDGSPVPELTGLYEDEFVRGDGEWKILRRVDNPIMPTPEEWRKEMAERQAGR